MFGLERLHCIPLLVFSLHFLCSVPLQCPDYYELVEYPIDVQQLRIRAKKEGFESHEQLHKEVQCLVQNTLIYYGEDSEEGCHAHNVDKYMNKRLKDLGLVTKKAKGKKRRKL